MPQKPSLGLGLVQLRALIKPRRTPFLRTNVRGALLVMAAAGSLATQAQERPTLQVLVSSSLTPPFVVWRDNQAVGGIDVEIAQALAALLKTRAEFTTLPRLRVEVALKNGEGDIACNLSPLLASKIESQPQPQAQSPVLFEIQEMLAGHSKSPGVDTLEQLPPGTVVGTLQGQAYPLIDALFSQGRLKRDDALDDERLLRKLAKERHPYGVSSRHSYAWFREQDEADTVASWRLPVGSRPYRCSYSPNNRFDPHQLNAALEQLLSSGQIDKIIKARAPAPLAVVVSVQSGLRHVSRSALTELFMGQRSSLGEQGSHEPVLSTGPERQQFFDSVLLRNPAQYRSAWAAQQFGGRRRAPQEFSSVDALKKHLQHHAQAVGFMPLNLVDSSLRIIYLP
ncbi:substrate-binding periplasmic protein [Roseateles sp.]|uniref:substrate-binding periplasmic protein n=1 Tax=Roseateles sp. TaxID=1971397 RepID=UPI003BA579C9